MPENRREISNFFIAGINYKKTDAALRSQFAIGNEQYAQLLEIAKNEGLKELFVVSTCNRTEIYGFAENVEKLMQLICTQTQGSFDVFSQIAYTKSGNSAIEHLFDVAAGLDSQILGDYEILGQIKQAVKFSKERGFIGAYLERIINAVLQCSKEIKTTTELSSGTVSVSFAAIQYIKEHVQDVANKKILLVGTGKIGRNTCKNLVDYLETKSITLINRTDSKAQELAVELGVESDEAENLSKQINAADIIIVSTNANEPIILKEHVENTSHKLIIDLSIPYNVETAVASLPNIHLVNVDGLSKIKDATLNKRIAEVPKAKSIIQKHMQDFFAWHEMRKYVPVLKTVKHTLTTIHNRKQLFTTTNAPEEKIQKVLNGMAVKMKTQNQQGCHFIEAINEFID